MTTQPAHDRLDVPFWQVQGVFDPDGTGKDFAYTIGLHTRGLPELHIWARPSLGEDPGEDWIFSLRDRTSVLNELAGRLVEGTLGVGSELTEEYDDGLARVVFRVDPPGDKHELEAFGVPDGVDVLPVRWSLHRAPEGPLRPLTAEAEKAARELYDELVAGLDPGRPAPRGWALPATPSFAPDQRFGPLTPVVLARAAQLWQADRDSLTWLLHASVSVNACYGLSHSSCVATALARPVGRRAALVELSAAAQELVGHLTTAPPAVRRWDNAVRGIDPAWWRQLDREGRRQLQHNLGHLLCDVTSACLAVEAVADVADRPLLLAARGPWVTGLRGEMVPSHPDWQTPPLVRETIRGLLSTLDLQGLAVVARLHVLARIVGVQGAEDYPDLCGRLLGWATVSAAACPRALLDELPGWQPLAAAVPGATVVAPAELHEWATCLASALTHRARLSSDDVRTFALPFAVDLPQLTSLLNGPL